MAGQHLVNVVGHAGDAKGAQNGKGGAGGGLVGKLIETGAEE